MFEFAVIHIIAVRSERAAPDSPQGIESISVLVALVFVYSSALMLIFVFGRKPLLVLVPAPSQKLTTYSRCLLRIFGALFTENIEIID